MPENNTPNTPQGQGQEKTVDNKAQEQKTEETKESAGIANLRLAYEKAQAKIKEMETKQAEAEKLKLEEQGKHKELYEQEKKAREELEAKIQLKDRTIALEKALSKAGINAEVLDLVTANLIDQVETDKKGAITNLDQLVEELKTSRPILFSTQNQTAKVGLQVANNSNPDALSYAEIQRIINSGDARLIAEYSEKIQKSLTK